MLLFSGSFSLQHTHTLFWTQFLGFITRWFYTIISFSRILLLLYIWTHLVFGTDFKAKMPQHFWTIIVNFDHSVYSLAKWKEIDISTLALPFSLIVRGLEGAREPRLCQSLMALKQELHIKLIILGTFHGQTCIFC